MKRSLPSVAVWAWVLAGGIAAAGETGGVAVRRWDAGLEGRFRSDSPGSPGTRLDFGRDLGLNDTEQTWEFEGWFRLQETRIRATFYQLDFRGSTTLSQAATFDGATFPAGQAVDSRFRWDVQQVDLETRLGGKEAPEEKSGISFDLILGGRRVEFGGQLRSASAEASFTETGVLPHVGLGAEMRVMFVHGSARVLWGNGGYGSIHGTSREERYAAGVHFGMVSFDIGYHRLMLEVGAGDTDLNATVAGTFLEASLRF